MIQSRIMHERKFTTPGRLKVNDTQSLLTVQCLRLWRELVLLGSNVTGDNCTETM